jgi:hypothetical protein
MRGYGIITECARLCDEADVMYVISVYHGCTALVDLGRFSSFLIYTQSVGLLGRGISPPEDRYVHTE